MDRTEIIVVIWNTTVRISRSHYTSYSIFQPIYTAIIRNSFKFMKRKVFRNEASHLQTLNIFWCLGVLVYWNNNYFFNYYFYKTWIKTE